MDSLLSQRHGGGADERALRRHVERVTRQQTALLQLMITSEQAWEDRLRAVLRVDAQTLGVARVSYWLIDPDSETILCQGLYRLDGAAYEHGAALSARDYPSYFAALRTGTVIVADDALTDGRTCEFTSSYLRPSGIGAMLDVPVYVRGVLAGVICHEHVGGARAWSADEQQFAMSMGQLLSLAIESLGRRRAEEALRESEARFRFIAQVSPIPLILNAMDGRCIWTNDAASVLSGVPADEIVGRPAPSFYADPGERAAVLAELAEGGVIDGREVRLRRADGSTYSASMSVRPVTFEGQPALFAGFTDLTQRKQMEDVLRQGRDRLRGLLDAAPTPLLLTRLRDGVILQCNESAATMFGLPVKSIVGHRAPDFYVNREERATFLELLARDGRVDGCATRLKNAASEPIWVLMNARQIIVDGEQSFFVGFTDVTKQKQIEDELRILATTDGLTGAMNRRSFDELAAIEVERVARYGPNLTVAILDVDHFKKLNDRFGHQTGDEALRVLRRCAQSALRRVDVLARYGGEEFVVLLPETGLEAALIVLERMRAVVAAASIPTEGAEPISMTVSIGVAAWQRGESVDDVVRRADAAMYAAKHAGRNLVRAG